MNDFKIERENRAKVLQQILQDEGYGLFVIKCEMIYVRFR